MLTADPREYRALDEGESEPVAMAAAAAVKSDSSKQRIREECGDLGGCGEHTDAGTADESGDKRKGSIERPGGGPVSRSGAGTEDTVGSEKRTGEE